MNILHIVPGMDDVANGMVVVAKLLAKEQGDAEVVDLNHEIHESGVEEVWVHGMWLPKEWVACWRVLRAGKRLVRMTHGSLSPLYLRHQSPFKKWLVGPIERWCLRRCDRIVATCEAEKGWIERYLGKKCPAVEVTDIKRFFKLTDCKIDRLTDCEVDGFIDYRIDRSGDYGADDFKQSVNPTIRQSVNSSLNLLYLGRRHPLKGVEYLEQAVAELNSNPVNPVNPVQNSSTCSTCPTYPKNSAPSTSQHLCVRFVSNAFGEEKERVWDWCDVLVLPTLSENFGLVIAEALERGKRVITTDGAPAWGEGLEFRVGSGGVEGEIWSGYEGRLIYLKGYRDGTDEERVELLKRAIERIWLFGVFSGRI